MSNLLRFLELDSNNRKSNLSENMSDYVIPIKVDNFSLNADDLLYESKRNLNNGPYNNGKKNAKVNIIIINNIS